MPTDTEELISKTEAKRARIEEISQRIGNLPGWTFMAMNTVIRIHRHEKDYVSDGDLSRAEQFLALLERK